MGLHLHNDFIIHDCGLKHRHGGNELISSCWVAPFFGSIALRIHIPGDHKFRPKETSIQDCRSALIPSRPISLEQGWNFLSVYIWQLLSKREAINVHGFWRWPRETSRLVLSFCVQHKIQIPVWKIHDHSVRAFSHPWIDWFVPKPEVKSLQYCNFVATHGSQTWGSCQHSALLSLLNGLF